MLLGAAPIVVFSFGVFLKPLTEEFHAGRAAVSLAITILNFSTAIVSTLVGFLCDRIGARQSRIIGECCCWHSACYLPESSVQDFGNCTFFMPS